MINNYQTVNFITVETMDYYFQMRYSSSTNLCELGTWLYVYRTHRHMLHFRHASKHVFVKVKLRKAQLFLKRLTFFPTSDIKLFGNKITKLMWKNALYNKQYKWWWVSLVGVVFCLLKMKTLEKKDSINIFVIITFPPDSFSLSWTAKRSVPE